MIVSVSNEEEVDDMFDDVWEAPRVSMNFNQFFAIEDRDLQEYIYLNRLIPLERSSKRHVDNDEKVGYYLFTDSIKMNKQGKFYMISKLNEWIVYRKEIKKVSISGSSSNVFRTMLEDYFYNVDQIYTIITKVTPTLCKKIIEGSINTLGDFVRYIKSYVVRKKDLSVETVYRYIVTRKIHYLQVITDPENATDISQLDISFGSNVLRWSKGRSTLNDIKTMNSEYRKWTREQNSKLGTLKGQ